MSYKYIYVIKIEGMRCGACEAHVNDLIRKNFKIKKVKSSHFFKKTKVFVEAKLDENKLKNLIEDDGYLVKEIKEIIK